MATFVQQLLVQSPEEMGVESWALGADGSNPLANNDLGKAVKMGTAQNFLVCSGGDDIEGIVDSISAETVNSGYGFGGVQRKGRMIGYVGANQGGTAMAVGDLVVADAQAAVGTANTYQGPAVKTGSPTLFNWRCIRLIEGAGTAGKKVLLERV